MLPFNIYKYITEYVNMKMFVINYWIFFVYILIKKFNFYKKDCTKRQLKIFNDMTKW